ncbi:CpsB/CapC family capsule biosynthesis tyrosine phosphatase [Metabacillus fastidiosus]|uniref:tyrosine-protein phosphatase n=1 Tax=Metabacillus fastidiosus TaxID=1458 RepID=UPI002E1D94DD|nr:CpsB/CapC family capsule biosynthesis tyrosine phosphatase [Metabacillus fastidiosus]MED4534444.1 tyrosine protein phosphatase [Metabacillus fastidiosus]
MIDIHSHILPNVDDGPQNINDSINMAQMAVEEGITKIIATPHHQNGRYTNKKERILKEVEALNQLLERENILLEVLPGQETRIYGEILEDLEKGEILSLNQSNYLFIELPSGHVPRYTEQLLFDIQLKGLTPIIVHPERNAQIFEDPDLIYKLVEKGILTQVTAGSLAGQFGKEIQKFTCQLIEASLTHFIASDAHNVTNRSFQFTAAMNILTKEFGNPVAIVFKENAELIIDGDNINREIPERIIKRKFFGIF